MAAARALAGGLHCAMPEEVARAAGALPRDFPDAGLKPPLAFLTLYELRPSPSRLCEFNELTHHLNNLGRVCGGGCSKGDIATRPVSDDSLANPGFALPGTRIQDFLQDGLLGASGIESQTPHFGAQSHPERRVGGNKTGCCPAVSRLARKGHARPELTHNLLPGVLAGFHLRAIIVKW
jgi:hypothetical protein